MKKFRKELGNDDHHNGTLQAEPFLTVHILRVIKIKAKGNKRGSARRVPQWMDCAVNLILFSFGKITTKVFTRSVRVLYVVCSRTKVVLNLIELLIDSLTVSQFFAAKKFTKNLISTTSAC